MFTMAKTKGVLDHVFRLLSLSLSLSLSLFLSLSLSLSLSSLSYLFLSLSSLSLLSFSLYLSRSLSFFLSLTLSLFLLCLSLSLKTRVLKVQSFPIYEPLFFISISSRSIQSLVQPIHPSIHLSNKKSINASSNLGGEQNNRPI